jgi:hypothetical protein
MARFGAEYFADNVGLAWQVLGNISRAFFTLI